ncbi:MAG: hypothetical protein FWC42_02285 [Proteobacteria bacterium]|nr:hypothetical protein [Pseudomonadota bacterium]MCL2309091.1 hypothetical protein [Pseudomonadota bacterium]
MASQLMLTATPSPPAAPTRIKPNRAENRVVYQNVWKALPIWPLHGGIRANRMESRVPDGISGAEARRPLEQGRQRFYLTNVFFTRREYSM